MALQYPFQAVLEALIKARQAPPASAYAANALSTGLGAYNTANEQRMKNEQLNKANLTSLAQSNIAKGNMPTLPVGQLNNMDSLNGMGGIPGTSFMGGSNIGQVMNQPTGLPTATNTPRPATSEEVISNPNVSWNQPTPKKTKQEFIFSHVTNEMLDPITKLPLKNLDPNMDYAKVGEIGLPKAALEGVNDPKIAKMLIDLGKDLDPKAVVRSAFGTEALVYDRAERLQGVEKYVRDAQAGIADKREIEGFAIGLQSLMSGSNQSAQELVKALVPKTLWGNAKGIAEWVINKPLGTDQQEFTRRMMGEIEYEKRTAAAQIKKTQFQRIAKHQIAFLKAPELSWKTANSFGVQEPEYENWSKNGFDQNVFMDNAFNKSNTVQNVNPQKTTDLRQKYGLR